MSMITNRQMKKLTRHIAISSVLVIVVALAFASKGDGDKKGNSLNKEFTPIRSMSAFTLKSTTMYSGNYNFYHEKENHRIAVSSFVTYQKGNTTYILPYKYKVNTPALSSNPKTNLQFLGVKIKMPH